MCTFLLKNGALWHMGPLRVGFANWVNCAQYFPYDHRFDNDLLLP